MAPKDGTLSQLRHDFYELAKMYIIGNYGEFSWPESQPPTDVLPIKIRQRLWVALPRFLGVVLPLILMGLLLWKRKQIEFVDINFNIVALIFIAWLLLAIDASLKLGIVSGVVGLAREIKSLK